MKILIVCQYYYPEQFRINDISRSFKENNHDVTVLTGLPNYPSGKIPREYRFFRRRREVIDGIKVIRVPLIGRGKSSFGLVANYLSFMISSFFYALFCSTDYDAVYVHQTSPVTMAVPALVIGRRAGIGVLLYCLDIWPESLSAKGITKQSLLYKLLFPISRNIYRGADKLAVTTLTFKSYFKENFDIEPSEIEYIPQYAEDLFSQKVVPAMPHENINLIFAGNVGELQSVETIIRAAALTRDIEALKWHIVGEGSAKKRCEALVKETHLENIVIFHGYHQLEEMPAFYSMADAMLITLCGANQVSNTVPGKMQTYLAAGKPVIGAINGETQRIIHESGCGLCCDAEDYKALARIVRQFVSEPEKAAVYAKNASEYYKANFEKSAFIQKTLELLKSLKKD